MLNVEFHALDRLPRDHRRYALLRRMEMGVYNRMTLLVTETYVEAGACAVRARMGTGRAGSAFQRAAGSVRLTALLVKNSGRAFHPVEEFGKAPPTFVRQAVEDLLHAGAPELRFPFLEVLALIFRVFLVDGFRSRRVRGGRVHVWRIAVSHRKRRRPRHQSDGRSARGWRRTVVARVRSVVIFYAVPNEVPDNRHNEKGTEAAP
jgi:hypothetical protein